MDEIIICPLDCIIPGVLIFFHRDDIKNCNIVGQIFIQPEQQIVVPGLHNIKMKKELTCVYHCIGPSASNDRGARLQNLAERFFKDLLNTGDARLKLPTTIIETIISNVKKEAQYFKV